MNKTLLTTAVVIIAAAELISWEVQAMNDEPVKNQQVSVKDSTYIKMNALEQIANGVKDGYLLIENGVVKGYKSIENGVVDGFTKLNDAITLKLFGKDGESIEETKARLNANIENQRKKNEEILERNRKTTEEAVKAGEKATRKNR